MPGNDVLLFPHSRDEMFHRFSRSGLWKQRFKRAGHCLVWGIASRCYSAGKRTLDLVLTLALIPPACALGALFLAPFWATTKGPWVRRTPRIGRGGALFDEYSFAGPDHMIGRLCARTGVLFNILKGDMSWIGPRAVLPQEMSFRNRTVRTRCRVRPGVICLWWLRRRANIAYDKEAAVDAEYVEMQSLKGDLGILLRALPAALYGESAPAAGRISILGIPIDNLSMGEAVEAVMNGLDGERPRQICFVNADCANIACRDAAYSDVLLRASLRLADGIGIKLAGKMLRREVSQNVNGTDLFPRLCEKLVGSGKRLFLLGGRPGVAEGVRDWLFEHHPEVVVSGCHHGFFSAEEEPEVLSRIAASKTDLLLVALGAPRQDKWLSQHLLQTGVKVGIGVGGLFDFYSGRIPRAPLWMREMCLEWLYRFIQEPRRMWKRYFVGNAVFLFRVAMETTGLRAFDPPVQQEEIAR